MAALSAWVFHLSNVSAHELLLLLAAIATLTKLTMLTTLRTMAMAWNCNVLHAARCVLRDVGHLLATAAALAAAAVCQLQPA